MATLKLQVIVGANTYEHAFPISNTSATRWLNCYKEVYDSQLPDNPTNQQVVDAVGNGLFTGMKAFVKNFEEDKAERAGKATVTDLD